MLKVISFKICPFFQYVAAMLEAKKVPYQVEYADFNNCLFDVSPNGKAPILITESGAVLFDADAIVAYISRTYPGMESVSSDEELALSQAWALYGSKNYVPQCSAMRSDTEQDFESAFGVFAKSLNKVESVLGQTKYFLGNELSSVDIAWLPLLHRAALVEKYTGVDLFDRWPKIKAWQSQIMTLDIVEKSVSEDFEAVFSNFYLSPKTYLGSKR
ncbi:glutathione S-transferase family protein [Photobacterium sp. OFAV2-7]|uniref:glutathione S-transferase family protein n=1 Tax=Photobacterium sp. OFAV2-7 TaxID=2917748 RepID=UPI001EF54B34|nr:glutathione S-transferase family protein [Photobacterium sp. OFAV2-7]MCG7584673.1 glutathione S-transferase family protein [Photobacterium sp. OFAV2-7]